MGSNAGLGLSLTPISLVNQVDPTGQRVFTTTVADGQGAFVLHWNGGQWAVGSGQLGTAIAPAAPDETVLDTQFTAHCSLPTAHYLEDTARYLQLVFGELALTSSGAQQASMGQPAVVLDTDEGDVAPADTLGLASPLQTNGVTQTDWTADNYLAYLRQSTKHPVWTTDLGGLDGNGDDGSD